MANKKRDSAKMSKRGAHNLTRNRFPRSFLAGLALLCACESGEGKTAYVGATLFDGQGGALVSNAVILVAQGRIEAVGPSEVISVPRGAEEVRLDGKWVIPGLIDAHTHTGEWMLSRFMSYGVTSIRDLGSDQEEIFRLWDAVNRGTVVGPRMYLSGAVIDGNPGYPGATVVTNGNEARRAIDQLVLAEAAQAKIFTKIDIRLLRPLMDEALTLRLPVAGHLGKVDAVTAAEAGVRILEHMTGVVEAAVTSPRVFFDAHNDYYRGWNTFERGWAALDSTALDRVASRLVELGVAIVPTLVMHEAYSRLSDPSFVGEMDLAGVPDSVQRAWDIPALMRRARLGSREFAAFRRSRPVQDQFVRMYARAGGVVAAGTNTPREWIPPGSGLHTELALLVQAGLEPQRALLAATRDGASLMGADSIGVLRAGAVADFVVLYADPFVDITNSRAIEMVISGGSIYRPEELQRSW
jgi:imidazolonepropionase-like amidohydrolase